MPRTARGPYLYLRKGRKAVGDKQRARQAIWVIRDGEDETSTGCAAGDRSGAERFLEAYLTRKHRPAGSGDPADVLIADMLNLYVRHKTQGEGGAKVVARPDVLLYTVTSLEKFWGDKWVSDIKAATCREYVTWRVGQPWFHAKWASRKVSVSTARRELETLRAAVKVWHAEYTLTSVPVVTLPPPAAPRERWLTRSEVARLLWAAWREPKARHLCRFILLGVYTGTRHLSILKLSWMPTTCGGWIDLDREILYRRPEGAQETKKRRPPVRIPRRLLAHLRRWHAHDAKRRITHVVHYHGAPITKERRAWRSACGRAGLGPEVVPHIMRHTAATWLMHACTDLWETAGYLGMTVEQLEATYGHHHPDFQKGVRNAF